MTRGRPLYLNEERYAALTYMVNVCLNIIKKEAFVGMVNISCFTL